MNDGLIPKRYAKALYKLAGETGERQEFYEKLKPLSRGLSGLDDVKRALLNPYIPVDEKGRVMSKLIGTEPGSSLDQFILLVIKNNRAEYLRKIALAYVDIYREEHRIAKVVVTSATEMPEHQLKSVLEVVRRQLGDYTLEVEQEINPGLIGGFTVKIGDLLLDASVKNELNKLRLKLQS